MSQGAIVNPNRAIPRFRLNNVTPFTYRDGLTFLELIEELREWATNVFPKEIGGIIDVLVDELADASEQYEDGVQEFQRIHDAFMADVNTALMALNDTAVANLVGDPGSELSAALMDRDWKRAFISVTDFGAQGDGVTDDTLAIREAIAATPRGGTLIFPAGLYKVTRQVEPWIMRLNRATKLVGLGGSTIMLDVGIPTNTDVILIQPDVGSEPTGYAVTGLTIAAQGSATGVARHALHFDLTAVGARVRASMFTNNNFGPTGGRSIKITNPVNTDGIWSSLFANNFIWSGIHFERAGDSIWLSENTIAGDNAVDISQVGGSAGLVIEKNNITCRGGVRLRSGTQVKIHYNNFEVGYPDATGSNGAMVDIDGSEISNAWGILAVEVRGNNFGHRTGSPDGIDGLRINKARSVIIEGNHFGYKDNNQIHITSLATETILGYNQFSSDDPAGVVLDNGRDTLRRDTTLRDAQNQRRMHANVANVLRTSSNENVTQTDRVTWRPKATASAPVHTYEWHEANSAGTKHLISTQQRFADGTLGDRKNLAVVGDGFIRFSSGRLAIMDSGGRTWALSVSGTGELSTTQITP